MLNALYIENNKPKQSRLTKHQEKVNMKSKLIAAVAATTIIIGFSAMSASAWNHMGSMMNSGMA